MYISGLWLKNFRSYEQLCLPLTHGLTVLAGDNAQGKTNVLEAAFFCCTARSHRTNRAREMIRWGEESSYVRAEAQRRDGSCRVEMRLTPGTKSILVNGLPVHRVGEMLGSIHCVMFSPEDLSLVKSGPSERRRFMDTELSQLKKSYYYALRRYMQALEQRNTLLRKLAFAEGAHLRTLDVWDEQLASLAAELTAERCAFVERLNSHAQAVHSHITLSKEQMSLRYVSGVEPGTREEMTLAYLRLLQARREEDVRRATTTVGAHRDDIAVLVDGKDMRSFGSQGQQRTAALSLKLSELDLVNETIGEYPVLFLDDVLSELDPCRQTMLLDNIRTKQTLLTTAAEPDEALLRVVGGSSVHIYSVENSTVKRKQYIK